VPTSCFATCLCTTSRSRIFRAAVTDGGLAGHVLHERDGAFADERDGYGVGADAVASGAGCGMGGVEESQMSTAPKSDQLATGQKLRLAVKIAAGMAFVQAGITAAFVVVLIFEGNALTGGYGFGLYSLSDVIAIMGFALALLKGRLWAAYGLFAYGLLDWVAKAVQSGQVAWIVPVMLYGIGAISLSRSEHLAPVASELRWKRAVVFAAVWVAGDVLIGFLLGLFGLTRSGVSQTSAVALSQTCLPAIWGAAICYAAARRAVWPFETVLLIAILTSPIAIVDLLSTSGSPLLLLASIVSAIALSMIGWGLVILFPAAKLAMEGTR